MSRIGKEPIALPTGVTVTVANGQVVVKGPKGELSSPVFDHIEVNITAAEVSIGRSRDDQQTRAFHGLVRSMVSNNVKGVTEGYKKTLKLVGTGYRAQAKGQNISLAVGYSHPVEFSPLAGVTLKVEGTDTIYVEGIDKQAVGQVAANIRKVRPPEPYKGKGIRYDTEVVKTKPGKTAA